MCVTYNHRDMWHIWLSQVYNLPTMYVVIQVTKYYHTTTMGTFVTLCHTKFTYNNSHIYAAINHHTRFNTFTSESQIFKKKINKPFCPENEKKINKFCMTKIVIQNLFKFAKWFIYFASQRNESFNNILFM